MDPKHAVFPVIGLPVTLDDLRKITQGRDASEARTHIVGIIRRMEPRRGARRVYVCEPRTSSRPAGLWDIAYDLTISVLTEEGDRVIDPHFLEILVSLHPTLAELSQVGKHNLLLAHLLDKGLIDVVYLPGNVSESEYNVILKRTLPSPCPVSIEIYHLFIDEKP